VTSVGFFISYAKSVVYLCIETGELLEGFPWYLILSFFLKARHPLCVTIR
jgi:hypothetical protein